MIVFLLQKQRELHAAADNYKKLLADGASEDIIASKITPAKMLKDVKLTLKGDFFILIYVNTSLKNGSFLVQFGSAILLSHILELKTNLYIP